MHYIIYNVLEFCNLCEKFYFIKHMNVKTFPVENGIRECYNKN